MRWSRSSSRLLAIGLTAIAVAGCGISHAAVPNLSAPAKPTGKPRVLAYPSAGVALLSPSNWYVAPDQRAPLVTEISSGPATIAVWHYARGGPALTAPAALAAARSQLLVAIRHKDPTFHVIASALTSVDGVGAVELDAIERVDGRLRRTRSEHIYPSGGEIVLDEYAPVGEFSTVDHYVFSPVRKTLTLLPPARAGTT